MTLEIDAIRKQALAATGTGKLSRANPWLHNVLERAELDESELPGITSEHKVELLVAARNVVPLCEEVERLTRKNEASQREIDAILKGLLAPTQSNVDDALETVKRLTKERDAQPWDGDRPLPEDDAIDAAHPCESGRHELYAEAMRLVGAKHSKGALVALVNWLLAEREALLKREPVRLGKHPCPACGKMTRDTTAGCDHCELGDE